MPQMYTLPAPQVRTEAPLRRTAQQSGFSPREVAPGRPTMDLKVVPQGSPGPGHARPTALRHGKLLPCAQACQSETASETSGQDAVFDGKLGVSSVIT